MIQRKSPPAGDPRLWLEMRRLENSWRCISDIELALLDAMIVVNEKAGEEACAKMLMGIPPTPLPCLPPSPCRLSVSDLRDLIRWLAEVSEATVQDFQTMVDDAEKLGIEEIKFRVRQYPGYPETSDEALAGVEGGGAGGTTEK